jgi:hypothetical protein
VLLLKGSGASQIATNTEHSDNPFQHTLVINLHFPDAHIRDSVQRVIDALRRENARRDPAIQYFFARESKKWNELHRQLEVYDLIESGRTPTEAAKSVFGPKPTNSEVTSCLQWHQQIEKFVKTFNLFPAPNDSRQ